MGLARRAGQLSYGLEAVKTDIKKNRSRLILTANDLSDNTKKELLICTNERSTAVVEVSFTKEEIGLAIGAKPTGIISIKDENIKKGIIEVILIENKKENI